MASSSQAHQYTEPPSPAVTLPTPHFPGDFPESNESPLDRAGALGRDTPTIPEEKAVEHHEARGSALLGAAAGLLLGGPVGAVAGAAAGGLTGLEREGLDAKIHRDAGVQVDTIYGKTHEEPAQDHDADKTPPTGNLTLGDTPVARDVGEQAVPAAALAGAAGATTLDKEPALSSPEEPVSRAESNEGKATTDDEEGMSNATKAMLGTGALAAGTGAGVAAYEHSQDKGKGKEVDTSASDAQIAEAGSGRDALIAAEGPNSSADNQGNQEAKPDQTTDEHKGLSRTEGAALAGVGAAGGAGAYALSQREQTSGDHVDQRLAGEPPTLPSVNKSFARVEPNRGGEAVPASETAEAGSGRDALIAAKPANEEAKAAPDANATDIETSHGLTGKEGAALAGAGAAGAAGAYALANRDSTADQTETDGSKDHVDQILAGEDVKPSPIDHTAGRIEPNRGSKAAGAEAEVDPKATDESDNHKGEIAAAAVGGGAVGAGAAALSQHDNNSGAEHVEKLLAGETHDLPPVDHTKGRIEPNRGSKWTAPEKPLEPLVDETPVPDEGKATTSAAAAGAAAGVTGAAAATHADSAADATTAGPTATFDDQRVAIPADKTDAVYGTSPDRQINTALLAATPVAAPTLLSNDAPTPVQQDLAHMSTLQDQQQQQQQQHDYTTEAGLAGVGAGAAAAGAYAFHQRDQQTAPQGRPTGYQLHDPPVQHQAVDGYSDEQQPSRSYAARPEQAHDASAAGQHHAGRPTHPDEEKMLPAPDVEKSPHMKIQTRRDSIGHKRLHRKSLRIPAGALESSAGAADAHNGTHDQHGHPQQQPQQDVWNSSVHNVVDHETQERGGHRPTLVSDPIDERRDHIFANVVGVPDPAHDPNHPGHHQHQAHAEQQQVHRGGRTSQPGSPRTSGDHPRKLTKHRRGASGHTSDGAGSPKKEGFLSRLLGRSSRSNSDARAPGVSGKGAVPAAA